MIFELIDALMSAVDEAEKAANEKQKNNLTKRPTAEEARQPHPHALCPNRNGGKVPKLSELIKSVSVNEDFVVIRWADETVMHVKKHKAETFDIEKAIAMATLKYLFGNKYYSDFVTVVAAAKYHTTVEEADVPSGMPTNSSDVVASAPVKSVESTNKSANKVKKTTDKTNTTRAKSGTKATKNTKTENKTSTTKTAKTTKSGKTTKGSKTAKNTKSSKK